MDELVESPTNFIRIQEPTFNQFRMCYNNGVGRGSRGRIISILSEKKSLHSLYSEKGRGRGFLPD